MNLRRSSEPGLGRTLMVVTPYFAPEGGGLESYALNLAETLRREYGWRIVVVTSGDRWGHIRRTEEYGFVVYRLPYQFRVSNTRFGVTWTRDLRRIIDAESPILINAHAPVPGLADLVAGLTGDIPFVVTYHAGSMRKGRWPLDAFILAYESVLCRRLLKRAAWIITSSDFVRDSHLTSFRAKCSTVTPGVDVNVFKPAPEQATDHVLFVGGLNRSEVHKGLDVLLTAMVQLRQDGRTIRLNIAGTGNRLPHYEQRAQTLGIAGQVRFLGRLTGADLVDAYTGAAVIALPTRNDSFPMVLVEAMACGLPVVSTKVGGIPELVQDGTHGILVDPGHPTAFVDALRRILDDPRLGARMGRAGREKVVRTQSWGRQAGRTNAIFESVLEGRPGEGTHRLAVVIPHFAPKIGGAERYAAEIAKSFNRKQGYDVTVFTSKSRGRSVVEVLDGLTVFRLSQWFTVSNTPLSPMWPRKLRRAMTDNRIDLVNVHTPVPFMAESAALACRDRPLVVTYHTGSMVKNKWSVDWLIRLYERRVLPRLLRRADAVVAVSPSVRERLRPHAGPKTELVTPAVDTDVFLPELSGGQTEQAPTILFVGRIERSSASKGIDHLIKAFHLVHRELPAAQLVLVGGGDAVDDHRRAAASLGISDSVTFRGVLTGKALVEANQQSSLLALPSTTETESFGMSIIEAMACKKPVVASDVGGIPSVVDHGSDGLLVPPGDVEGLASACLEILRTPGLAAAMGEAGYRKVMELYTWPSRIDRYEEIFSAIIGSDSNTVARHGRTPSQPRTGGRS